MLFVGWYPGTCCVLADCFYCLMIVGRCLLRVCGWSLSLLYDVVVYCSSLCVAFLVRRCVLSVVCCPLMMRVCLLRSVRCLLFAVVWCLLTVVVSCVDLGSLLVVCCLLFVGRCSFALVIR